MPAGHAYPPDLAAFVIEQWPKETPLGLSRRELEQVLATCHFASLTTEEGRPVRFRLLLTPADALPEDGVPNHGVLRLRFAESRPFNSDELRRLSPAVPFESGLIGAHLENGEFRIWGVAHSGPLWLAPSWGGRRSTAIWTHAPIVHVTGPGRLAVRSAGRLIAGLERGVLVSAAMDVFESEWLPRMFAHVREGLRQEYRALAPEAGEIDNSLIQTVGQHMIRRVVRLVRGAGHGGMILIAEPEDAEHIRIAHDSVRIKYTFAIEEPRTRYRTLMKRLMSLLASASQKGVVGWEDFRDTDDLEVAEIEQAIFELSRLIASLSAIDGAVLLSKKYELIGFGAEVSAELPSPSRVWRALDVEGERRECDFAESVGTRHRAAYRFVQKHPTALAIVISHDGAVRFVASTSDGVTYWEQSVSP